MKRVLLTAFAVLFFFGLSGSGNALLFTDTVDVGALYGADSDGHIWQGYEEVVYSWEHSTPSDFNVPPDIVNSATLQVYVGWVDTFGDDHLDVASLSLPLTSNTAWYTLDIGEVFIDWAKGDNLIASLTIYEDEYAAGLPDWGGDIILGDSTFTLDYENVPEPATMLLFGSGLIGLVGIGRRRFRK